MLCVQYLTLFIIYKQIVNYRLCNNYLPVETLRWYNVDRNDRTCPLCNSLDVGDEYHYLFTCSHFSQLDLRKQLLPVKNLGNTNTLNYCSLMNENNENILLNLCKFVSTILKCFQHPPGTQTTS